MPPKPEPTPGEGSNPPPPPFTPPPAANAEEARARLAEMERQREANERSGSATPTENEEDLRDIRRLGLLAEMLRRERSAIVVTNAALETGRPTLLPAENMRGDPTNMYNRVSTEALWRIKSPKVSNNIATAEEMVRIQIALEGLGIPTDKVSEVIIRMALLCANTSSSSYQDPQGTIEWDGGAIIVDDVFGTINEISTVRKVCRLYAAVVWNHMHIHKSPPSDWAAMGYQSNTKYAAFDFFDYVENNAAIKPAGGVVPRPTPAEYVAHATFKRLALNRATVNETYGNVDPEITGGRQGPRISTNFNNANNRSQH